MITPNASSTVFDETAAVRGQYLLHAAYRSDIQCTFYCLSMQTFTTSAEMEAAL